MTTAATVRWGDPRLEEIDAARRCTDAKLRVYADLFAFLSLAEAVTVIGEVHDQLRDQLRDDLARQETRLQ